ncbi:hypothetical protein ES708_11864 [subsurface metagenome]
MKTKIGIDGIKFLINGVPTYVGRAYNGQPIEGLLFNSRMVQAIFDDENPETRAHWAYPDTKRWDPDRNTYEFCENLPVYREKGLLAVTVGLQGGGSVYTPSIYNSYENSAFNPDGTLRIPYFNRLLRILKTADEVGMVVIVNYFYWQHARRFQGANPIKNATINATDWLLKSGYQNILVDVVNESSRIWKLRGIPMTDSKNVHSLIHLAQSRKYQGRCLLVGASSSGGLVSNPSGKWLQVEDFSMPHGNGCKPVILRKKIRALKKKQAYKLRPRPILINEDSVFTENLHVAVEEGISWGFYCQDYGSGYRDLMNWKTHPREKKYENLSGFQTVPVNWGINTQIKKNFFDTVERITSGEN